MQYDRKALIKYLSHHLTDPNRGSRRFRMLGPNTLICEDERDKVVIYVNQSNLIIINDGENVFDGIEMIPMIPFDEEKEADEMNSYYLQPILHKF